MNFLRRNKAPEASAPVVPPRPSHQELQNSVRHRLNPGHNNVPQGSSVAAQESKEPEEPEEPGRAPESEQVSGVKASYSQPLEQNSTQNSGRLRTVVQKMNPFRSTQDPPSDAGRQSRGPLVGVMHKMNPFKSAVQTQSLSSSSSKKNNDTEEQDSQSILSSSSGSLGSLDDSSIVRHSVWYTDLDIDSEVKIQPEPKKKLGNLRGIFPGAFSGTRAKVQQNVHETPDTQVEMEKVEVQTTHLAEEPRPDEGMAHDPLDDEDGLMSWWRTVEGWDEWNEAQDGEDEQVVEDAADRVFMAARLFVRLLSQRGASLQQRVLQLLAMADSADCFHRKAVAASMGGGVASVAGSITTITGLVLAPFTMGTSLIVTAVGIGVATAGGVASASANITDTVHSKTDRKKVEKMIQDYQEEMQDIQECLQFLQDGMEALEDWDFQAYAESISRKHLNQNVKHVVKEGGRAGKALLINAESLVSTVQVLGVAGGAAKAVQVMSVTTGVMSGLFLALDVFFLAKDSMELRKGAKTEFATKIREVCTELQGGLLELHRIKEELQRTMEGLEDEEQEEVQRTMEGPEAQRTMEGLEEEEQEEAQKTMEGREEEEEEEQASLKKLVRFDE